MPVFSMPPPNDSETLQNEKHTWYVGTQYIGNYFTVYDNRPTVKEKLDENGGKVIIDG